jgi:hypothetical protein
MAKFVKLQGVNDETIYTNPECVSHILPFKASMLESKGILDKLGPQEVPGCVVCMTDDSMFMILETAEQVISALTKY